MKNRYCALLGRNKMRYVLSMVMCNVIASFCYNLVLAIVMKYVIDATQYQDKHLFVRGAALAAGSFLLAFTLEPVVARIKKAVVRELTADIRIRLTGRVVALPAVEYESLHSGEIITTVMQDVQRLEDLYLSHIPNLCFAVIHGVAAMAIMLYYNAALGGAAILLGLVQVTVSRKIGSGIKRTAHERQKSADGVLQQVIETLDGRQDIDGCNAKEYFQEKFEKSSGRLASNELKARLSITKVSVTDNFCRLVNQLMVMGIGLICIQNGILSVGIVAAVLKLQGNASYLFENFTSFYAGLSDCLPSIERIDDILKLEPEGKTGQQECALGNAEILELKNIYFAYQENRSVLNSASMKFEKGKFYCIVGESGSGKSTLQKILLKFYEPQGGEYEIDGRPSTELSPMEVRRQFAYVSQRSNLFAMSVEENLRLVKEDASLREIVSACRQAEAHDFIMTQGGYDYEIDSSADNLSGGQSQRIELARMFLSSRPIWLIDEGTAHLDKDTEKKVMAHIMQHKEEKIIIMVTHHEHLLSYADEIYRLGA